MSVFHPGDFQISIDYSLINNANLFTTAALNFVSRYAKRKTKAFQQVKLQTKRLRFISFGIKIVSLSSSSAVVICVYL